ncbi:hypothetical protein B0H12DRAFT_1070154 [Mycena haematopus]|nr:hypothetical protein B0H12DRAFT_1070154 [Mycena haematopus]
MTSPHLKNFPLPLFLRILDVANHGFADVHLVLAIPQEKIPTAQCFYTSRWNAQYARITARIEIVERERVHKPERAEGSRDKRVTSDRDRSEVQLVSNVDDNREPPPLTYVESKQVAVEEIVQKFWTTDAALQLLCTPNDVASQSLAADGNRPNAKHTLVMLSHDPVRKIQVSIDD